MLRAMKNGYLKVDAFMNKHQNKIWVSALCLVVVLFATFIYMEATRDVFTITITK